MEGAQLSKSELRSAMRLLSKERRALYEGVPSALTSIESRPEFIAAGTVLLYMALPDEVPTVDFIRKWSAEKRIALPVVRGESLELREYDTSKLSEGYMGILEPSSDAPVIDPSEIGLAIIPGMAFDLRGGRLGRGKGFYDRLLPMLDCPVFGLCQPWRLVPSVPADPWDIKVDAVFY